MHHTTEERQMFHADYMYRSADLKRAKTMQAPTFIFAPVSGHHPAVCKQFMHHTKEERQVFHADHTDRAATI